MFRSTDVSQNGGAPLAWWPGSDILYQQPGNRNYRLLDPITELDRPLVRNDSVGWLFSPQYSPRKRRIAVYWNRYKHGLWLLSTNDTLQTFLAPATVDLLPLAWSPDGKLLYAQDIPFSKISVISASDGTTRDVVESPFKRVGRITMNTTVKKIGFVVMESNFDAWLSGEL